MSGFNYICEGQISIFDYMRGGQRTVEEIEKSRAKNFIERIHYSRKMPSNTIRTFGLFIENELKGVVCYGIPPSPPLCRGLAGEENRNKVYELNRLAISDDAHKDNNASYLVSKSLKMLPNHTFVVSYADTGWGHVGYIYQACNFYYTGLSVKRVDRFTNGKHPRCYNKEQTETKHQTRNRKHRYVYLVGDKREKKQMLKELRYPIIKQYPKGESKRYDTSNPQILIPIKIIEKEGD